MKRFMIQDVIESKRSCKHNIKLRACPSSVSYGSASEICKDVSTQTHLETEVALDHDHDGRALKHINSAEAIDVLLHHRVLLLGLCGRCC